MSNLYHFLYFVKHTVEDIWREAFFVHSEVVSGCLFTLQKSLVCPTDENKSHRL